MISQSTESKRSIADRIKQSDILVLILALVALCAITYFLKPVFLSERNIMNTLRQVSLTAICGFGLTMIILVGEIDLSVGSQQAVAGIITVAVLNATGSIFLAIVAALAAGLVVGGLNGLLVTKLKINSLIVTLGTMAIWRGVSMVVTNAVSIQSAVPDFLGLATGFVGPVPNAVIIAALLFVVAYYVLNHTTFGRYIYAIGGNHEASRFAGLPVDRMKLIVYIVGSVLSMLSGVLLASRMASAQPTAGTGFEMIVIASVILGGVSLSGGIGTITGALIGMLILGVLQNALTLMDVSSFWQDITRGIVIILAVGIDSLRKDSVAKRLVRAQQQKEGQ
jgi:ribose transport system permease protein